MLRWEKNKLYFGPEETDCVYLPDGSVIYVAIRQGDNIFIGSTGGNFILYNYSDLSKAWFKRVFNECDAIVCPCCQGKGRIFEAVEIATSGVL